METVSAASSVLGLAVPIFQSAKFLRDRIKQVLGVSVSFIGLIPRRRWQAASEKAELLIAVSEYEKEISHLASLYNDHKALLDQHSLSADLVELDGIIRKLNNSLPSTHPDLSKRKLPTFKEVWRAGDVRERITTGNAAISSIRCRWQVRLQVCTLASTMGINARLEHQESGITEIKAMLQQLMQTVSMLQQGRVRQLARSLSMHPQVEPAGFKSQTTTVIANTTTTAVTFSILSPSTALAYDQIKLRLGEYRKLLASNSDTIELPTENGTIVLCRKQASGMETFLDQAESLLQDIVQSRNTSMLVVLHRLRDLAKVLDNLKLGDECRLAGDCALKLAVVLGQRLPEFKREQAETLALIAGLSVYQPRACILFSKAVSICEEAEAKDASVSSKLRLFTVLAKAGCWSKDHPDRGAQWLKHAVELIATGLPSTTVPPYLCSVIFNTYGNYLCGLKQYADAVEVCQKAVSIQYSLVSSDPVKYTSSLVRSFMIMGDSYCNLGEYYDAIATYKAAEEHCRAASAQDPFHYSALLAKLLYQYGVVLSNLNQVPEAAEVQKEAISHFRNLAGTGSEDTTLLCYALHDYGTSCHILGKHSEAVLAYTECICLGHTLTLVATDSSTKLIHALHNMANSLHALGQYDRANTAASKARQMNQGRVLEHCRYAPGFGSCFVCQRAIISSVMA